MSGSHVSVSARGQVSLGAARPRRCRVPASPQPRRKGPKHPEQVPHTGLQPCASATPASAPHSALHAKPLRQGGPSLSEGHVVFLVDGNRSVPADSHLGSEDPGAPEALRPVAPCHTDELGLSAVGGELTSRVICLHPGVRAHGLLDHEYTCVLSCPCSIDGTWDPCVQPMWGSPWRCWGDGRQPLPGQHRPCSSLRRTFTCSRSDGAWGRRGIVARETAPGGFSPLRGRL